MTSWWDIRESMGRYRKRDIYGVAFPIVSNLAGSFLLGRLCLSDLYNDKNAKGKLCVCHKGDNCSIKISRCWAMALICQDSSDISAHCAWSESDTTSWCWCSASQLEHGLSVFGIMPCVSLWLISLLIRELLLQRCRLNFFPSHTWRSLE